MELLAACPPDLFEGADEKYAYFSEGGNGDITRFLGAYLRRSRETRNKGYISLPFANHDLPRINREAVARADIEVIYAFELSMQGVPAPLLPETRSGCASCRAFPSPRKATGRGRDRANAHAMGFRG